MLVFADFINEEVLKQRFLYMVEDVTQSYPITDFVSLDQNKKYKMRTCVDIGCNLGAFSALASKYFEEVFSFEPGYAACNFAKRFINMDWEMHNVKIYNLAVGKNSGEIVKLAPDIIPDKKLYYSGDARINNDADGPHEKIPSINLEKIYELIGRDFIDYLKIDCEGSEYDILLDQDTSKIGIIAGELHGLQEQREQLLEQLSSRFKIWCCGDNNFCAINKKFSMDMYSNVTEDDARNIYVWGEQKK